MVKSSNVFSEVILVFEKLKEIICDYFEIEEDEFTKEASLVNDFGLDELDLVDLSMDIEDVFEIEVTEEDLEKIATVGDLVKFVEENIK